jgi:molybdopterin biosynthesis enzyme MoaB
MTDYAGTVCLKPEADAMIGGFVSGMGVFSQSGNQMETFVAAALGGVVGSTVVKLLNGKPLDFNGAINSGINGVGGWILIYTLTGQAVQMRYLPSN